ncbi:MerR family transcriptional regulator [Deinococcus maricopensis]|uniref:Transcriptional regulator, MerR family n=1 Tax=Deinococcus maricopensis (strain DSM 21211 / LMG 22137 / NRRL B-23946 / LB-34) TaxID=709986 RepID=E8UAV6_DEIML|nr:MerR family transcriptional regulator [Deinococcus maricopensis]ADV68195.1 transcriptional regulator, MerR family [Deinococcus maricopensis DSM 21211]
MQATAPHAPATLSIREAAETLGVTAHTLRYYERVGLLTGVPRDASTHRQYTPRELEMLRFLLRLRATGMPIRQMSTYVDLVRAGEHTLAERQALLAAHERAVVERIAQLQGDLQAVRQKLNVYATLAAPDLAAQKG